MSRKPLLAKDSERGARFREICSRLFPNFGREEVARELGGISPGTIRNLEIGQGISRLVLSRLENMGVSMDYLLRGTGEPLTKPGGKPAKKPRPSSLSLSPAEALAANLRHLRRERFPGWGGQRRFAEFLGLSPNDLCVYEYGRALPNEQRLEEVAARLGFPVESLIRLLPGVNPASLPNRNAANAPADSAAEAGLRLEAEELHREIARLEARVDVLQNQLDRREDRIRELEEANLAFRSMMYLEETPEAAERRRRLLEKMEASLGAAGGEKGVF